MASRELRRAHAEGAGLPVAPAAPELQTRRRKAAYLQEEAAESPRGLPGTPHGSSGVLTATLNLANTIIGASLTGLPSVASSSGLVPFTAFLTFSALMGYMTLRMLVTASGYVPEGKKDYQAVGSMALGGFGFKVTAAATCLSCLGALTSYFVLVATTAPTLCKLVGVVVESWKLQVLAALAIIWPLCTLEDISALAPSSLFALLVFGLMALAALGALVSNDDFYTSEAVLAYNVTREVEGARWFPSQLGLKEVSKFPTIVMAFNCQYALLPILADVRGGSKEDMQRVCAGGMSVAYVVYLLVAVCAYMAYGGHTKGMILLNFRHCYRTECLRQGTSLELCGKADLQDVCEDKNPFITALNVLFLLAVLMGYPCVQFALRKAQTALCAGVEAPFSRLRHLGLAALNVSLSLGIALLVGGEVSVVFNWTGAVASPLISFILPSLFYFVILGRTGVPLVSRQRLSGLCGLGYGIAVMCLGVSCNVLARE